MKLVLAILNRGDAKNASEELGKNGYSSTVLPAYGGFLQKEKSLLMVGVSAINVDDVLQILDAASHSRQEPVPQAEMSDGGAFHARPPLVTVGGAVVFVLDAEQFHKL